MTSKRLLCAAFCIVPLLAQANPVSIDGESLIAFGIVAFWALVIESAIVTLGLVSRGVLIIPLFGTLVIANLSVFLFGFLPLCGKISLWILEPAVVLVDGVLIKLVASAPFFQGANFLGVTWRRAFTLSLFANAASYFIGVIASHAPWVVHDISIND